MSANMNTAAVVARITADPSLNTDGYLGVPKATLLTWRARRPGYGPHAVKAGGRLKYRLSELDRWLRAHEESFSDEEVIGEAPAPLSEVKVRTRRRASRVRGAAAPAGGPDEVA